MKRQIKLVLVPGFSYLSLGAILEPLETLKGLASEIELNVDIVSLSGHAVEATSGLSVNCPILLEECLQSMNKNSQETVVFICCGLKMPHKLQTDLKKLLRVCKRNKVPIYGSGLCRLENG